MTPGGAASRKRKLAFETPTREVRQTHAWVTSAGLGCYFFVELAGDDVNRTEDVIDELSKACSRGTARVSAKNAAVVQAMTGSDKNTAKLSAAAQRVLPSCPISTADLNYFGNRKKNPKMHVGKRDSKVVVKGDLYMLEPFLTDPEGLAGTVVEPSREYDIAVAEDLTEDDIVAGLKQMAAIWGWSVNCS